MRQTRSAFYHVRSAGQRNRTVLRLTSKLMMEPVGGLARACSLRTNRQGKREQRQAAAAELVRDRRLSDCGIERHQTTPSSLISPCRRAADQRPSSCTLRSCQQSRGRETCPARRDQNIIDKPNAADSTMAIDRSSRNNFNRKRPSLEDTMDCTDTGRSPMEGVTFSDTIPREREAPPTRSRSVPPKARRQTPPIDSEEWRTQSEPILRPTVRFSDRSDLFVYDYCPSYRRTKSYTPMDKKIFQETMAAESKRIKKLMVATQETSAKDAMKHLLKNNTVSIDEIIGLEHMVLGKSTPSRGKKERFHHSREILAMSREMDFMELAIFSQNRTSSSARRAWIRAGVVR